MGASSLRSPLSTFFTTSAHVNTGSPPTVDLRARVQGSVRVRACACMPAEHSTALSNPKECVWCSASPCRLIGLHHSKQTWVQNGMSGLQAAPAACHSAIHRGRHPEGFRSSTPAAQPGCSLVHKEEVDALLIDGDRNVAVLCCEPDECHGRRAKICEWARESRASAADGLRRRACGWQGVGADCANCSQAPPCTAQRWLHAACGGTTSPRGASLNTTHTACCMLCCRQGAPGTHSTWPSCSCPPRSH